jgi:fibrillarin-like pre-rRNA processing protein
MADASKPETYASLMEYVDLIYQDVADPRQVEIARRNLIFLKKGGALVLVLKTRSVDSKKKPEDVRKDAALECEKAGILISSSTWLRPYHRDHAAFICTKR